MQPLTNVVRRRYAHVPWLYRVYLRPGERHLRRVQGYWRMRRAATVSLEDYRARVPLGELEEFVACTLCGETRQQPLYEPRAPDGGWRYRVVRCPGCGFLYRNPNIRPERLRDLYATGYSRFLTGRYAQNRQRRYQAAMDAVAPILDDGTGRRLLDFGCGSGLFLELAEELGFVCSGVDLSPDSIDQARQRLEHSTVKVGSPTDIDEVADGFDLITMWSVLAHLPRPVDDLSMLRDRLAPHGVLVIFTVNAGSLLLASRGSAWSGFTRNHLMFYGRDTLPRLLAKAGFAAVGFASFYGEDLASGTSALSPGEVVRLKQRIDATDGGNMLIAVGFATVSAVDAWGGGLTEVRRLPQPAPGAKRHP